MSPAGPGQCSSCGAILIAWSYIAHDGDLLFAGAHDVIEGQGEAQKRAALICHDCDRIVSFPRYRR